MHQKKFSYGGASIRRTYFYGEISVRRNIRTAKFPTAKFPYGEISLRRNVLMANFPYSETFYGEVSHGEISYGEFSGQNQNRYIDTKTCVAPVDWDGNDFYLQDGSKWWIRLLVTHMHGPLWTILNILVKFSTPKCECKNKIKQVFSIGYKLTRNQNQLKVQI